MENNNQLIEFNLPNDGSVVVEINNILRRYNLKKDFSKLDWKNILNNKNLNQDQIDILEQTAIVILQKKISDEKLAILLEKHLVTSQNIAQKIIADVRKEILPFMVSNSEKGFSQENKVVTLKIPETPMSQNSIKKENYDNYRESIE